MSSSVLYFILLLSSLTFVFFRGGPVPFALFYTVLLYLPLSLLYLLYIRIFLHLYQELPSHHAAKGDEVPLRLVLENAGPLPILSLSLTVEETLCEANSPALHTPITLTSGERRILTDNIRLLYAGTYPVGAIGLSVRDFFGFFHFTLNPPMEFRAIVSPRILENENMPDLTDALKRANPSNPRRTEDIAGSDLRSYVPGDTASRIHWKNSIRTGSMLTRLPEQEEIRPVTVLLASASQPISYEEYFRRDAYLEAVVSLAWFFTERRLPARFCFPSENAESILVDSYEGFQQLFSTVTEALSRGGEAGSAPDQRVPSALSSGELVILMDEQAGPGGTFMTVVDRMDILRSNADIPEQDMDVRNRDRSAEYGSTDMRSEAPKGRPENMDGRPASEGR